MLTSKVALITGASRGIGAATAVLLGQHGCRVGVNYHSNRESAEKIVQAITTAGSQALAVQADVRSAADVQRMVAEVTDRFDKIDILVLNAGMPVPVKPFAELSYDEFIVKTKGETDCFIRTLQEVVPQMIARREGIIVGISSSLSRYPSPGFSSHTMAKSGVDGLMKSLAMELGPHGIRVNTVAPGLTATDATAFIPAEQTEAIAQMTPLGRIAQPEDIAGAILCVVSDHMRFVTGTYIPVTGGLLMP
jgi:3-oxoacyl-[acyl-carrier protein] reductase